MSSLEITTESAGPGVTIIDVAGDITFGNAEQLARTMHASLDAGATRLVLDVTRVGFMDSSGLSALLRAANSALRGDGSLVLVHRPDGPPNILRFKGVEQLMRMLPSREAALADPA